MSRRIDDIEVLRAFAVLGVVVYHGLHILYVWSTPTLEWLRASFMGGAGVDLFLAISGFVIARELVPRLLAATNITQAWRMTLAFWTRRAWRLLPSAWLWLALILLASLLLNQTGVFESFEVNLEATLAGVFQYANVRFAYTFMQNPYGASFVYWSLSLEEQFYLLLPLLVLVSRRFLSIVLIGLILYQWFTDRTLMMVVFRTDALALGVLLAIWSHSFNYNRFRPQIFSRHRWLGIMTLLVLCLLMGLVGSQALLLSEYRFSIHAALGGALVWLASYNFDLFAFSTTLKRLLLWIGSRSYAIYLSHVPVFFFTREIYYRVSPSKQEFGPEYFWQFTLVSALLIVLLSDLNYRFIESPLRKKGLIIASNILRKKS
ncbi:Peptidoglycan/LPS O-acetylase OafA/YrhL, contains acyltransferase and SGNH-hydrolase domains [Pseudomonas pohangensis]|uniref:Peptidoglycan/LPS O-acetylase OafA/YrhL, contains acyltransferase and SGNH-hydrolase domains n=1 Tax=Pseudomonas pohangensis TaxID=364197 RepID=A0A1H2HS88_9PSED|nr:acyltransferase [Pseudomonas pohangensis]SDU34586.1 Peptidoglycan/LPS O-acetylase OafA/YrhL, contains acyltransferase and SGNH-hydrolase domains [Pseudomonas pohangensis]